MKRDFVFPHVRENPEAPIQLISKRQPGSIQTVGNDLLRPGKNIGHQTHGRLRGQNEAICRPSLRSVNRKRTLICRSGNQIHINRICRKSKGSLSDMKFLSAHFPAFLILQHGVLPYVNDKCTLFGIRNPAVCASRPKPPIPTLYYTISSPKSEVRCPVHRQKEGRHLLPPADDVPFFCKHDAARQRSPQFFSSPFGAVFSSSAASGAASAHVSSLPAPVRIIIISFVRATNFAISSGVRGAF